MTTLRGQMARALEREEEKHGKRWEHWGKRTGGDRRRAKVPEFDCEKGRKRTKWFKHKRDLHKPSFPLFDSFAAACQKMKKTWREGGVPHRTCCWVQHKSIHGTHWITAAENGGSVYYLIDENVFMQKQRGGRERERQKTLWLLAAARLATIIFWQPPRISPAWWWQPISGMSTGTNAAYDYIIFYFFW